MAHYQDRNSIHWCPEEPDLIHGTVREVFKHLDVHQQAKLLTYHSISHVRPRQSQADQDTHPDKSGQDLVLFHDGQYQHPIHWSIVWQDEKDINDKNFPLQQMDSQQFHCLVPIQRYENTEPQLEISPVLVRDGSGQTVKKILLCRIPIHLYLEKSPNVSGSTDSLNIRKSFLI